MKRYLFIINLLVACLTTTVMQAQTGTFRFAQLTDLHLSMHNPNPTEDLLRSIARINATDSIFWDKETNLLFAVQKCDKDTNSQDTTNVDPITQKWWDMMADIMEVNPDNSPVSIPLEELFHMD